MTAEAKQKPFERGSCLEPTAARRSSLVFCEVQSLHGATGLSPSEPILTELKAPPIGEICTSIHRPFQVTTGCFQPAHTLQTWALGCCWMPGHQPTRTSVNS